MGPVATSHQRYRRTEWASQELTRVRVFLKTNFALRACKVVAIPVPPKKTTQEQARFLEQVLEVARAGLAVVFFVDAAHFVWAPFLGCLWCLARDVRAVGDGAEALQRAGGVERGDARGGPGLQRRLRQRRDRLHAVADAGGVGFAGARSRWCWTTPAISAANWCQVSHPELGIHLLFLPSIFPTLNFVERL